MSSLLRIIHGDESWEWDMNPTQEDSFVIKAQTGLGNISFHQGVFDRDPDCIQTLLWMLRRSAEPSLKRRNVTFDLSKFDLEDADDEGPPTSAEPSSLTVPNATTAPSEPNGSGPSPASSDSPQPITTG